MIAFGWHKACPIFDLSEEAPMYTPRKFLPAMVLGITAASAAAIPITYTEQATATGSLGGVTLPIPP